jgi:hypothetical protein
MREIHRLNITEYRFNRSVVDYRLLLLSERWDLITSSIPQQISHGVFKNEDLMKETGASLKYTSLRCGWYERSIITSL